MDEFGRKPTHFKLDGHVPVPCDLMEWAKEIEGTTGATTVGQGIYSRVVGRDTIKDVLVSTVFLGLDHNFTTDGPPILFETMAFDEGICTGESVLYENRYSTWDEAEAGHKIVIDIMINEKEWPLYIEDENFGRLVTRLLGK